MGKHISKDAYYERLKFLANTKGNSSIVESKNRAIGTLIDYDRAADGVAYGIIKENHNYYIKKGGLKKDPDIADFAYIGGLGNITEFQYKSLSEAEKQRNMLFNSINEAISLKPNVNGGKKKLNEDAASDEIKNAENKLTDLDAATASASDEMAAGLNVMPGDDASSDTEDNEKNITPDAEDADLDAEVNVDDTEATNTDSEEDTEDDANKGGEDKDIATTELEKMLGKITNNIRKTELTDSQVKSYVNTFLAAFKDQFPDIDIEDRKAMAEKITKVVPDKDIEDLGQNVEDTTVNEDQCSECGSFAQYAESRGYATANSLMECDSEEVGNLISGYANAHNDGMNDGDHENVALVIKIINPDLLNTIKNDYGHDEYAEKLEPMVNSMSENTEEDDIAKLNELFGGLKNLGTAAMSGIKQGAQSVYKAGAEKVGQAGQALKQTGQAIQQTYHAGEVAGEVKKLETIANDLGKQIGALNTRLTKAGKQPVNVNGILTTIKNQVGSAAGKVNLSNKIQENNIDPANIEVQPFNNSSLSENEDMDANDQPEINDINFAPDGQSLGAGVIKPEGASTNSIDINVNGEDKTINIAVNEVVNKLREALDEISVKFTNESSEKPSAGLSAEKKSEIVKKAKAGEDIGKKGKGFKEVAKKAAKEYGSKEKGEKVAATAMWKNIKESDNTLSESEQKIRKYVHNRLEELAGLRKSTLNESKKSPTLKKLDKMIDEQFKLYESIRKKDVNEIFGLSSKDKFAKLNPNDSNAIEQLFNSVFSAIINNREMGAIGRAAKRTPSNIKYNILKQYFDNNGGTLRTDPNGLIQYASKEIKSKATPSQFASGGTGGRTAMGGV